VTGQNQWARKKAELLANGKIFIPSHIKLPYPLERSTAGPAAGSLSITLSFHGKNIKLEVCKKHQQTFSLQKNDNTYQIFKEGREFLDHVILLPTPFHAPGQIFINLDNRCIYNCAFCNRTTHSFLQKYDEEIFIDLILRASKRHDISAIALTSGIYPDNSRIITMMGRIIQQVKTAIPDIPIGVEPSIFKKEEIAFLKKAGADEIKINLQLPNKYLFDKICPNLHFDTIKTMLRASVEIFGRGKVTSNIIFGLGESDACIQDAIEYLAKIGVVATLRKIRINQNNKEKIEKALSTTLPQTTAERILFLASEQKKILEHHNLTSQTFNTMCHSCGCCDIVPFWDI